MIMGKECDVYILKVLSTVRHRAAIRRSKPCKSLSLSVSLSLISQQLSVSGCMAVIPG